MAEKSACQTRNPEVLGSIPALGTCWICSQLSQVQIHGHWLPPASWGFSSCYVVFELFVSIKYLSGAPVN